MSRLSRGQWLVLSGLALALVVVLVGLGTLVRQGLTESPLPTAVLPAHRAPLTSEAGVRPTRTAVVGPLTSPLPSFPASAVDVVTARRIEQLGRDVGQVRELPKQHEVPLNFLGEGDMASHLRRVLADSKRRTTAERQQLLLTALDLMPDPDEAFPPTVQTRARRLISFYDANQDQIFIGPTVWDEPSPDISLVHQYAHALIDQHFDLLAFAEQAPNADAARARDALIEGDAMLVLALHSFGSLEQADLDELAARMVDAELTDYEGYLDSRAMRSLFYFPYREGTRFAAALLQASWWPGVNAAYLRPPASTEQILHPEKYVASSPDTPRVVRLPDLSEELENWTLVVQDVAGELVLRAHLDQYLPDTLEAEEAAAGWDGDLAAVWRDLDDRDVLVMRILWDSTADAIEFTQSYTTLIDRRLRGASRVVRPISPLGGRWWRGAGGEAFLHREKDTVLIVWAPDADTLERILAVFVFGEE